MRIVQYTYRMPTHWATAFVNGDTSGLNDEDLAQYEQALNAIVDAIGNAHPVTVANESDFETGSAADYPPNALAGSYADYVFFGTEDDEPTTTVTIECFMCKEHIDVTVPTSGLAKREQGAHVQDCFPDLPAEERELFISKTCPRCWEEIFGAEE